MHFILGSFLVYTGIKASTADEEDEDPPLLPFVVWLPTNLNFVSAYDSKGSLWAQCEVGGHGEVVLPEDITGAVIFRLVFFLVRDFVACVLFHAVHLWVLPRPQLGLLAFWIASTSQE